MAAIGFYGVNYVGNANFLSPLVRGYLPAQNALFKQGDLLQQITTGTVTSIPTDAGSGGLLGVIGPTSPPVNIVSASTSVTTGNVTITGHTSASALATTYYVQLTYTGSSAESAAGTEFLVNCPAGFTFGVNVASSGSPAAATGANTYVSVWPTAEALQNASATALGSAFNVAYPLTNSAGVNLSVTNPSANVVGWAVNSSAANFFSGTGGSANVNEKSLFGATQQLSPLTPTESILAYAMSGLNNATYALCCKQAYSQALVNQTAGLTYDTASGIWVVDTSAGNKIVTITGLVTSVAFATPGIPVTGVPGNVGGRVQFTFNSGTI